MDVSKYTGTFKQVLWLDINTVQSCIPPTVYHMLPKDVGGNNDKTMMCGGAMTNTTIVTMTAIVTMTTIVMTAIVMTTLKWF